MRGVWLRRDLRLEDNAAFASAKGTVLPLFIFDPAILKGLPAKDRRVAYIFARLLELKKELQSVDLDLALFYGKPAEVFAYLKRRHGVDEVIASGGNSRYGRERDGAVAREVRLHTLHDNFLLNPADVLKKDGTPYRVFTPFYNYVMPVLEGLAGYRQRIDPELAKVAFDYDGIHCIQNGAGVKKAIAMESIGFVLPEDVPERHKPTDILESFRGKFGGYETFRDFPAMDHTTRIGLPLRFGIQSVREVFGHLFALRKEGVDTVYFIRELVWREFYNYLFYHFPASETANFQPVSVAWEDDDEHFAAWCEGRTGVPLVDAGMRELAATGYMHNRVRMVVASFLTKNLLIDWKKGEAWFARQLLDYEASSNVGSWQWAASTGADAVPYFRLFNPYTQARKFDKEAAYIKRWVPELAQLAPARVHDEAWLAAYPVEGYPAAIVSTKGAAEQFKARYHKS